MKIGNAGTLTGGAYLNSKMGFGASLGIEFFYIIFRNCAIFC
jgi:hypothetical protein